MEVALLARLFEGELERVERPLVVELGMPRSGPYLSEGDFAARAIMRSSNSLSSWLTDERRDEPEDLPPPRPLLVVARGPVDDEDDGHLLLPP